MPDEAWKREDVNALLAGLWDIRMLLLRLVHISETMKKKRMSNREFFELHREQFERTDRLFRERLAYHDARRKAERAARGEPEEEHKGTS
ncbi:MAG TPA: hypothetical protein VE440_04875 [Gaiellaceae bacterium]|nr:hypothetical protein [Gaiellaceae bacterium]